MSVLLCDIQKVTELQRKSLLLTGEEYLEWNRRFKLEGFPAVVLEKILESPLDCKEIQPVHP